MSFIPPAFPANPLAGPVDKLTVEFLDAMGKQTQTITNWTTFNIERDFFNPADAFTLVLEDDRATQLNDQLQQGMALRFYINNNIVMTGYIFTYTLSYSREGGQRLEISGQDLLGYMGKGICYPNLGNSAYNTNFHFKETDTIQYALETIFNAFTKATNLQYISTAVNVGNQLPLKIKVEVEDGAYLTFATGFATGLKYTNSKSGRGLNHGLQNALLHLTTPNKGETYLAYALRLAKHIGCDLKLAPGRQDVILCAPPTYDRKDTAIPFAITHLLAPTSDNQGKLNNNVMSGSVKISIDDQPSVLITEMNSYGNNVYYQAAIKCICINEITGYLPRVFLNEETGETGTGTAGISSTEILLKIGSGNQIPLPSVNEAITTLTKGQLGTGYVQLKPNNDLYDELPHLVPTGIQMEVSLPHYFVDVNAHHIDELRFGTAKAMAEAQDKFMVLNYQMDGFTQEGTVWYPNLMCNVYDEVTSQRNPIQGKFWIKKVNYTRSRDGGTHTFVELTLPYTHQFNITTTATPVVPTASPVPNEKDYVHNLYDANGNIVNTPGGP